LVAAVEQHGHVSARSWADVVAGIAVAGLAVALSGLVAQSEPALATAES
jgi:hypothetical protein